LRFGGYASSPLDTETQTRCYNVIVETADDLRIVSEALGEHHRNAWVNVIQQGEARSIVLAHFIQMGFS
jgi:hypothetical protein